MIAWFARNHIAAALTAVVIVLLGLWSINQRVTLEVNPSIRYDEVNITVPYRGASPADVERNVLIPIERVLESVPGKESVRSEARAGVGMIVVKADLLTDPNRLMESIRPLIAGITTFPAEVEPPQMEVPDSAKWFDVIKIAVVGDMGEEDLLRAARRVRDDLIAMPGISQANVLGVSPREIAIEADPQRLRDFGLSFGDLTDAVRRSSLDLPAGQIQTQEGNLMIRTQAQAYSPDQFAQIVVRAKNGTQLQLRDVAKIRDGFEESRKIIRMNGTTALLVEVLRMNDESALEIAKSVKAYVAETAQRFPAGIHLTVWDDSSIELQARLGSLGRTMLEGCCLVLIVIGLFLRPDIALWVVMAIPVSVAGTLWLMPFFGLSLNVMSLFAFIIAVGLIVDDAIVSSENIFTQMQTGTDPLQSAIQGAREIAMPATFGTLTTIIAFVPLMFFDGFYGTITKQVPPIITMVLLFSLMMAMLILPSRMRFLRPQWQSNNLLLRLQTRLAAALEHWVENRFQPFLLWTIRHRYVTAAFFLAMAMAALGLIQSGRQGFVMMPALEKNRIIASISMPRDTKLAQTDEVVRRVAAEAEKLRKEFVDPVSGESLVTNILTSTGGWSGTNSIDVKQGYVIVEVLDSALRASQPGPRSSAIAQRWTQLCGPIEEAQSFWISADRGSGFKGKSGGEAVKIELRGPATQERDALVDSFESRLRAYAGIASTGSNLAKTREEIIVRLRPEGETLGLNQRELARQVRAAFFGEQVQRVQRDGDDIRVMVRLPLELRQNLQTLQEMSIRTPNGGDAPLSSVADVQVGQARAEISRIDGAQAVTLWGQAENDTVDIVEIAHNLEPQLQLLCRDFPDLNWRFTGYLAEHESTNRRLVYGACGILLAFYAMLAWPFRSLIQPLYIMMAIPFGVIGALIGHLVMGVVPSFLSAFGILAVAGIVVNNSIIMIDFINQYRAQGHDLLDAVVGSGTKRFRPILLTSLTSFVGLVPTMLDRSTQGQFLVPMAVSLAFGILFSTVITLMLIPSIFLIGESILERARHWWCWLWVDGKGAESQEAVKNV